MAVKRLPTVVVGSLILGIAVVLAAWPDTPAPAIGGPISNPRAVRVVAVEATDSAREARFPGVTRAARRAGLAFTVPARVATRPVEVGDTVHGGQIVATLDDREYRLAERTASASLVELEVRLAQAERDADRVRRLAEARAATAEELEQVEAATASLAAARDAATARLDETRRLLDEATLTAPFAGTVTAVHVEPGEWAAPGAPVVELSGNGRVEVRIEVPETVRPRVTRGSAVRVELPLLGLQTHGTVNSVAAAANGAGGLFPIVVRIDDAPAVVAGLTAEVVLRLASRPGLTVPLAAVLDSGSDRPAIFRIADGRAERIEVTPGRVIDDRIEIRAAGLAAGDAVAVVGHTGLVDGDAVEVF
jgi:RND family efflux transporter MFP subunit